MIHVFRLFLTEIYQTLAHFFCSPQPIPAYTSRQHRIRRRSILACATMIWIASSMSTGIGTASATTHDLPQTVRSQIRNLILEKQNRTPAQNKISSQLLYAQFMKQGRAITQGVSSLRTGVQIDRDGTTEVDITADVTNGLVAQVESLGGSIVNQHPSRRTLRVRIHTHSLESLANFPQVDFIRPADQMMTNSHDVLAVNTSEGDIAHRVNMARSTFGIDGTGITIGVISNGVTSLADRQSTGDLPPSITVLPGQAGSGDEGTAMLEIVHDLAPEAHLLFATALGGQANFAANINALRTAGADVIVDDVFYFAEPVFQDGIIAQAVTNVTSDGALYFSSAGNSGNLNAGTSGLWEGDFSPVAAPLVLGGSPSANDFGGGLNANEITKDPPFWITLTWSDPQGGSTNDYDLFLLSPDLSTVFASSTNVQNGSSNPYEEIYSGIFNDLGNHLVIVKASGESRYLHLNTHRGRLAQTTDGQISGHAAATDAFAVSAVYVGTAGGGAFTGGAANPVESFSSDGPRQMFYNADGTPITPGDVSSTGGTIRQKPDITAADGVATSTPGFNPFFGTSAAAPHAAAIAGLLLQSDASLTPSEVRSALQDTALDIEDIGFDRDSGAGLIDAFAAGQHVEDAKTFLLAVRKNGSGTGAFISNPLGQSCGHTCNGHNASYPNGTTITFTPKPTDDSMFDGWSGGGCSGTGPCTVTITEATTVIATFNLAPFATYPLVVKKSGNGTGAFISNPIGQSCGNTCTGHNATYPSGTTITFTPKPADDSVFDGWNGGGCSGTGPCTVTVNESTTVTAVFSLKP